MATLEKTRLNLTRRGMGDAKLFVGCFRPPPLPGLFDGVLFLLSPTKAGLGSKSAIIVPRDSRKEGDSGDMVSSQCRPSNELPLRGVLYRFFITLSVSLSRLSNLSSMRQPIYSYSCAGN